MSYYLSIDGIKGAATSKVHEQWIELQSLDFGLSCHINTKIGQVNNRESGLPKIGEFIVTKPVDQSSPYLLEASCESRSLGKVKLDLCGGANHSDQYLQFTLDDVIISHYDIGGAAQKESEEKPVETLHLNFTKIEMKYTPRDSSNRTKSPISTGYDLEKAEKI